MRFLGLLVTFFGEGVAASKPNILLFMTEDMSPKTGFAGDELDVTPNLNAFAKRGVTLTNVFSVYGVCAPSRSSFSTGRYAFSYGGHNMRSKDFGVLTPGTRYLTVPTPDIKGFPETLRQHGYWTYSTSKCDLQFSEYNCNTAPLSIWSKLVGNLHSGLWREQPDWDTRPWFGQIDDQTTHESKIFPSSSNPDVLNRSETVDRVKVPAYLQDTHLMRNDIASQYNSIAIMDGHFGDVLGRLEADELMDDTIVIWMSDHGDGLPRGKRDVYEDGIHAPCIIWIPEKLRPTWWPAAGSELDQMVSFIDFAPSLLDLAGVEVPETIQGKSLFGESAPRGDYVFGAKDRMDEAYDRVRYVRRKDGFKFIRNYMPELPAGGRVSYRFQQEGAQELRDLFNAGELNEVQNLWFSPRGTEEFYDLSKDPFEINNLAGTDSPFYLDVMNELRSALDEELASHIDLGEVNETILAEQFWPGGVQPVTPDPVVEIDAEAQVLILSEQAEGSSLMYRLKGCGMDLEWYVYNSQPVPLGSCSSVQARAQRYGWKVSNTTSNNVGTLV